MLSLLKEGIGERFCAPGFLCDWSSRCTVWESRLLLPSPQWEAGREGRGLRAPRAASAGPSVRCGLFRLAGEASPVRLRQVRVKGEVERVCPPGQGAPCLLGLPERKLQLMAGRTALCLPGQRREEVGWAR